MLAGLLFAIDDATSAPDRLVATLPFGGATLIEFQARLLAAAGATQIIIVVARLTPELAGAINRIARRGLAVDSVRTAREAADKLHPLARVVALAEGLVTTREVVAPLAAEGRDALLVTSDATALPGLDRVGRDAIWAGVARVSVSRVAEVAALPGDYDFQSSLLRVAAQNGALHFPLGSGRVRESHAIERTAEGLIARNQAVLGAQVTSTTGWADRFLAAPAVRMALPFMLRQGVSAAMLGAGSAVFALAGLAMILWGWSSAGLALAWIGAAGFLGAGALAWLADDLRLARLVEFARSGGLALAILLLGLATARSTASLAPLIAAMALVFCALLVERAIDGRRHDWWASPAAFPVVLIPFALAGAPLTGLCIGALYAAATLTAAIELLKRQP